MDEETALRLRLAGELQRQEATFTVMLNQWKESLEATRRLHKREQEAIPHVEAYIAESRKLVELAEQQIGYWTDSVALARDYLERFARHPDQVAELLEKFFEGRDALGPPPGTEAE